MIVAVDSYYYENKAKTVALVFNNWTDQLETQIFIDMLEGVAEYETGAFYKRELPCIISVLQQINLSEVECIIIDGYVYLNDDYKNGLGAHLFSQLHEKIPIIGVAKTNYFSVDKLKKVVIRANSKNPIYVSSIGMNLEIAANHIQQMHGEFRIPSLLKKLDRLTKEL